MSNSHPTYITKNRLGIYCFQYSYRGIPVFQGDSPPKKLFRKSLGTRSKLEAQISARYLWLIMQEIHKKYFSNPKLYGKAMELLSRYEAASLQGWDCVDSFLAELDDGDDKLLDLAIKQIKEDSGHLEAKNNNSYEDLIRYLEGRNLVGMTEAEMENPPISELVGKWLIEKQKSLKAGSLESARGRISLFLKILISILKEDLGIKSVSSSAIREFNEILQNLPARRGAPRLAKMPFNELIKLDVPKISSKTYHYYINTVLEFLGWIESQGYIENSKFKTILQSSKKSIPKRTSNVRAPFTPADLEKIFYSEAYLNGSFKRASDYWVPLIALYTGARLGEICQLMLADIKDVDGCKCFDINEDHVSKSIKSKHGSARTIPIHKALIKLNFLGYVKYMKEMGQERLFPLESRNHFNKFDAIQKRIANQFKSVGMQNNETQSKVFHSFRHTVRTALVDQNIDERTIDAMVGHSSAERSIGSKVYTHSNLMKQKVAAINKLNYSIDVLKIKPWDLNLFKSIEKRKLTAL